MLKKIITSVFAIVLTFAVAVLPTGCSKTGNKDQYSDTIDWSKIDWEGKGDSSKTITVYISNDLQDYYADKISKFERANSQYTVNVVWGAAGDGVKSQQNNAIGGGNAPDLILGGDVHILNQRGFLLPLNKLIERDADEVKVDDFMDGFIDSLSSGEGIYYLPTSFNVSLLLYNKTLFDKDSVEYPTADWTFDDFVEAGKKLTKWKDSSRTIATQWGNETITSWWTQWYSMYKMNGGQLFDSNGKVTLNNDLGIKSLQQWLSLCGTSKDSKYPETKIGTNYGTDGSDLGNFAAGKVAMVYSAHAGSLMTYAHSNIDFDIAPMPQMVRADGTLSRSGTELSITAYGIYRNSKNKKGAWELLKWLTAARTDLDEMASFANPVPRKSERDLLLAVPKAERATVYKNLEVIYDSVARSEVLPRFSYFEEIMTQYVDIEVNKMLEGKSTPAQAARLAQTQANDYIEYSYGNN